MKKCILLIVCVAFLFASISASAEIEGFELGHMEENFYINDALGISMEAGDIYQNNGGYLTYTCEELDETNGAAYDDIPALEAILKEGNSVICLYYANMDRRIIGKVNNLKLFVYLAAEGDENPETTVLNKGLEEIQKEADDKGYTLTKGDVSELELGGSLWSRISIDLANGDRHIQMTYAAVQKGECVYLLVMNINDDTVEDYFAYFRAR